MSNATTTTTTTTTTTATAEVLAACLQAASDAITATASKGAALTAFGKYCANGSDLATLKRANSSARESAGGKNATPANQRAYKLCARYIACAEFLAKFHLDFAAIGTVLSDKRAVSINLIERATRLDSDDATTAAFARGFQTDPALKLTVIERVALGDAAEAKAVEEIKDAEADRFAAAVNAAVAARLAASDESPAKPVRVPRGTRTGTGG